MDVVDAALEGDESLVPAAGDVSARRAGGEIFDPQEDLGPMRGYAEAAAALREWRRYHLRAQEIGASLPDPTLMAAALEKDAAGQQGRDPGM